MSTSSISKDAAYLGTQLGEELSISHVANRFIWTGRLDETVTVLRGCKCGDGAPARCWSPPRSDMLSLSRDLCCRNGLGQFRHSLVRACSLFRWWHEPLNVPASARRWIHWRLHSVACWCYLVISLWSIERLQQQQEAETSSLKNI